MMKELNLEVGQKAWSIQLGDCVVIEVLKEEYCYVVEGEGGGRYSFDKFGGYSNRHVNPSLFESNPFERSVDTTETIEPKLVRQKNDEWVENKAELINALCCIIATNETCSNSKVVAQEKLNEILKTL